MIHFNKLKRINGEFSRLNLYSIIIHSHLPREIMLRIKSTIYFTGQVLPTICL
jgi:hypothetical protein